MLAALEGFTFEQVHMSNNVCHMYHLRLVCWHVDIC